MGDQKNTLTEVTMPFCSIRMAIISKPSIGNKTIEQLTALDRPNALSFQYCVRGSLLVSLGVSAKI